MLTQSQECTGESQMEAEEDRLSTSEPTVSGFHLPETETVPAETFHHEVVTQSDTSSQARKQQGLATPLEMETAKVRRSQRKSNLPSR